jgi:hypothetical protein
MIGAAWKFILNLLHRLEKLWKGCLQGRVLTYDNIHLQKMEKGCKGAGAAGADGATNG